MKNGKRNLDHLYHFIMGSRNESEFNSEVQLVKFGQRSLGGSITGPEVISEVGFSGRENERWIISSRVYDLWREKD